MSVAVITLCNEGFVYAKQIVDGLPDAKLYLHESATVESDAERFASTMDLTTELFEQVAGLVYVMPCGVVVRAIAPHLEHKTKDPAVVMLDVGARYAVSLLSGHEGGANDLTVKVAGWVGAEPVISTTTEAVKTLIVGVGCRKGILAADIEKAILNALTEIDEEIGAVRLLASADVKREEPGLLEASANLGVPVLFIASDEIRASTREFACSDFVQSKVDLPAVAEPSALLAGRRTTLLLRKKAYNGITIAIARESCMW